MIRCALCPRRFEVGEDDPDAAIDDAMTHLFVMHNRDGMAEPALLEGEL